MNLAISHVVSHVMRAVTRHVIRHVIRPAALLTLALLSPAAFAEDDPWADMRALESSASPSPVVSTQPRRPRPLPATAPLPPVRPLPYDDAGQPATLVPTVAETAPEAEAETDREAATDPDAPQPAALVPPPVDLVPPADPAPPAELITAMRPAAASSLSWEMISAPLASLFPPAFAAELEPNGAALVPADFPAVTNAPAAPQTAPQAEAQPEAQAVSPAANAPREITLAMGEVPSEAAQAEAKATEAEPDKVSAAASREAKSDEAETGDGKADGDKADDGKAEPEAAPAPPLYRELRELQRLQDRMARGDASALPEQNALLEAIDEQFRSADPSVWKDPNNARALVVYVLSGGNPKTLRAILANGADPAIDPRLVRGAVAYVEGRESDAIKDLGEIDARTLPASLAGQVALAQAALWVRRDQARAAILLDQARILAPGTLVEEGALRRAILVAAQGNDLVAFERLTATYLGRFRHSVYAGNFRQRFAAALTRMSFIDNAEEFHRIDDVLRQIEPEGRRDILLTVAQGAVVQGKTGAAIMAADRVLKAAPVASLDAQRATLYRGAAMAASATDYETAALQLRGVSHDRLSPPDAQLLDAALTVVGSIEQAANVPAPAPLAQAPSTAAADAASDTPAANPSGEDDSTAMVKARDLLGSTDQLLTEAPL
ncbi:hypothetical protein [Ancylobacter radicis]|uniref:Chemotaxis protein MotC n=1 Tax=Ancylobacter radicis TaxID=2836179 RepID=A0ABS5RE38_9HYPH|nr:hypothetical protein [Ancylobacter radicis]MBS9479327.1 hypothetical protein [Ancylobacter radicis]